MSIDFTLPPDVVAIRDHVRRFMDEEVRPVESRLREFTDPRAEIQKLRDKAKREKLWNPHLPAEWGGLGLGPMAIRPRRAIPRSWSSATIPAGRSCATFTPWPATVTTARCGWPTAW